MITWLKERYTKNPALFIGASLVMAYPLYLVLAVIGIILYVVTGVSLMFFGILMPGFTI